VETPLGTTHRTDFLPMSAALPRYVARRSEQLHQYVVKHPTGWRKRLILSDMLFQAGRFDEAAEHYRAVVARRPAQWEAWMRLASALQYAGRSEEAADVLSWLEEASPSEEVGHFYRGLSWLARGRIDTAQESLLRASTSNECLPALSALATLYAFRGRPKDALDAAQKALEGDPQDIQALLVAYDTTSLAGRTPLADEYLVRALAVQADCVPALLRSFDRAHNGSDSNHAASVLRKLQRIAPDLPEVKSRLVDFYKSRGQVARARRAARSFVEAYPKHPTAWLARARLAFEYDDRDVASIAIQRALELAPDDAEIAMEATRIQREMTRPTHTPPPPRTTCPRKGTRTYDGGGASRV
jgi:tetratricopeptide (TPR) repeat protein